MMIRNGAIRRQMQECPSHLEARIQTPPTSTIRGVWVCHPRKSLKILKALTCHFIKKKLKNLPLADVAYFNLFVGFHMNVVVLCFRSFLYLWLYLGCALGRARSHMNVLVNCIFFLETCTSSPFLIRYFQ